jgi:hypothetical protein
MPFRIAINFTEATPQGRGKASLINTDAAESHRPSALCCGKAAKVYSSFAFSNVTLRRWVAQFNNSEHRALRIRHNGKAPRARNIHGWHNGLSAKFHCFL